ncbi:hypothetical protein [Nocardia sp. NPDC004604]|uniref:hypothetical protein n=1 Tax=Nocardia sp. NPDC004604 TaxID=3157013 RepID=UPI0033B8A472
MMAKVPFLPGISAPHGADFSRVLWKSTSIEPNSPCQPTNSPRPLSSVEMGLLLGRRLGRCHPLLFAGRWVDTGQSVIGDRCRDADRVMRPNIRRLDSRQVHRRSVRRGRPVVFRRIGPARSDAAIGPAASPARNRAISGARVPMSIDFHPENFTP